MLIDYNGERINIRPAAMQDLGTPAKEGNKEGLFIGFDHEGGDALRRAYVPSKPIDPPVFFLKHGGKVIDASTLGEFAWCDSQGYVIDPNEA